MSRSRLGNFLKDVKKEYEQARDVYIGERKTSRVHRGRRRIVASITEDLFAKYLVREFKKDHIHIFVDQPITLEGGKKQTYYPDLVICKYKRKNKIYEILFMIDLKMNIGWIRKKFKKYMKKSEEICKKMKRAKRLKGKVDIGEEDKEKIEFCINKKAHYDVVIVSSRNSGNKENESDLIKESSNKNSNLWVLSTGSGLSKPNKKAYDDLMAKMRKIIGNNK